MMVFQMTLNCWVQLIVLGNFDISDCCFLIIGFSNLGAPILMAVGGIDTSSLKPNIITFKTYPEKDKNMCLCQSLLH